MPPQTTYTNPSTTTPQQYHQGQHHIPPNSIPRGSGGQGMGSRDGSVKQVIGNVNTMVFNQGPYPRGGGGLPVNIHGVGIHPDGRVPLVDAGAPPVIDKRTKKGRAVTAEKRVIYIYIYICMYVYRLQVKENNQKYIKLEHLLKIIQLHLEELKGRKRALNNTNKYIYYRNNTYNSNYNYKLNNKYADIIFKYINSKINIEISTSK